MRLRMHPVLYVGNEPNLSRVSAVLLKGAGYTVKSTVPRNISLAIRECRYSAVILCATLTEQEAATVVSRIREAQINIPIVSMHLGHLGDRPHPDSSIIVDALGGPEALIAAVNSVAPVTTHLRRA